MLCKRKSILTEDQKNGGFRGSMQVGGVRIGMAWGWISTIILFTLNAVNRNIIGKHRHSARCEPAWQVNSEFAKMMVRVVGEGEGE